MADLIDRQEAIRAFDDAGFCTHDYIVDVLKGLASAQPEVTEEAVKEYCRKRCLSILTDDYFHKLTSAQPERKKGKWIDDGKGLYMCSSCGKLWAHWWARVVPPNQMCKELRYCPNCGADMRSEE